MSIDNAFNDPINRDAVPSTKGRHAPPIDKPIGKYAVVSDKQGRFVKDMATGRTVRLNEGTNTALKAALAELYQGKTQTKAEKAPYVPQGVGPKNPYRQAQQKLLDDYNRRQKEAATRRAQISDTNKIVTAIQATLSPTEVNARVDALIESRKLEDSEIATRRTAYNLALAQGDGAAIRDTWANLVDSYRTAIENTQD